MRAVALFWYTRAAQYTDIIVPFKCYLIYSANNGFIICEWADKQKEIIMKNANYHRFYTKGTLTNPFSVEWNWCAHITINNNKRDKQLNPFFIKSGTHAPWYLSLFVSRVVFFPIVLCIASGHNEKTWAHTMQTNIRTHEMR